MKLLSILCGAALPLISTAAAAAEPVLPLATAMDAKRVIVAAAGNGREHLKLTLRSASPQALTIAIPSGVIARGANDGARVIGLRAATAAIPARGSVEVTLPAAALSSKNSAHSQSFTLTAESEPRLTPLLAALADQPDAPRATVQLAAFCLLEDLTFAQWRQFLGAPVDAPPSPAEVTQAIDALGLLRAIAPARAFTLAQDGELKARALRNPWARAKAMAVYGLDLGDGAVPPDLRQLLHTQAGDNCPVCRQRALMQKPADLP